MASSDGDRVVAFSVQLAQTHRLLRQQLSQLRAGLGQRRPDRDSLTAHCLAFCTLLTQHHRSEDAETFPALLRDRPDLAGIVAKLVEDHEMIASILSRVAELGDHAARSEGAELAAIGRELDGLAAIMESHFRFEERAIGTALDPLDRQPV